VKKVENPWYMDAKIKNTVNEKLVMKCHCSSSPRQQLPICLLFFNYGADNVNI
jgi:hypothetical protein